MCTRLPEPSVEINLVCCTPEYRRASFVIEQWTALLSAIGHLNRALGACTPAEGGPAEAAEGKADGGADGSSHDDGGACALPFLDASSVRVYSDGLLIRVLLQTRRPCGCEAHADLASKLVDLARNGEHSDADAHEVLHAVVADAL